MGDDFTKSDIALLYLVCFLFVPICYAIEHKKKLGLVLLGIASGIAYHLVSA